MELDQSRINVLVDFAAEAFWNLVKDVRIDVPETVVDAVLTCPKWLTTRGSSAGTPHEHHAYPGGLMLHTFEVLEGALALGATNPKADLQVVALAALYHDYMKIRDYEHHSSKYRHRIRHVAGSYAFWQMQASAARLSENFVDEVGHCILAHHGRTDWGSPVEPQTPEAYVLHAADMMSCQYGVSRFDAPREIKSVFVFA